MTYTMEEKLALVTKAREPGRPDEIPDSFAEYITKTDVKDFFIEGRHGAIPVHFTRPAGCTEALPLFFNMHGGGFCKGWDYKKDQTFCSRIAVECHVAVMDIDYRLAPENPFPEGLDDAEDVVDYSLAHIDELNFDRDRMIIGGHSSGGNFATVVCMKSLVHKRYSFILQVLDYPPCDIATDPMDKEGAPDPIIPPEKSRAFNALYVDSPELAKNPYISPVFATEEQLKGMPPALVLTAGKDSLRFEAEQYAKKLAQAGNVVIMKRFLESKHGFTVGYHEEAEEAQQMIFETIRYFAAK